MLKYVVTVMRIGRHVETLGYWECFDYEMDEAREKAKQIAIENQCDVSIFFKPTEIVERIPLS